MRQNKNIDIKELYNSCPIIKSYETEFSNRILALKDTIKKSFILVLN